MIKTLSNIFKQDKEKFVIPRSVQQVIPIETIWSDGFAVPRDPALSYRYILHISSCPGHPPALTSRRNHPDRNSVR